MQKITLEDLNLDYESEYRSELAAVGITEIKRDRGKLICRCPFHQEDTPSFNIMIEGEKKGLFKCFGCDAKGNLINFKSRAAGLSTKEAWIQILKEHGKYEEYEPKTTQNKGQLDPEYNLNIEQYAEYVKIPLDFLREVFKIAPAKVHIDQCFYNAVGMPAMSKDGTPYRGRRRAGKKQFRWNKATTETTKELGMYGEWLLKEGQERVVVVEGESDTQTLTYIGIPTLGNYGANAAINVNVLKDIPLIIIHNDGDDGGKAFVENVQKSLGNVDYKGLLRVFSCKTYDPNCKDPADIHKKYGKEKSKEIIEDLIEKAELVNVIAPPPAPPKSEWINENLDTGKFKITEAEGIYTEREQKDDDTKPLIIQEVIIHTPITIKNIYKNVENKEYYTELQYSKNETIIDKMGNFTDRTKLLNNVGNRIRGLGSNNARDVAEYLNTLIDNNPILLAEKPAIERLGWYNKAFYPYATECKVFNCSTEITKVIEDMQTTKGTYEKSIELFNKLRKNIIPRIVVDLALASLFVRKLNNGQLNLFATEIWGATSCGKTKLLNVVSTMFTSNYENYTWTMNNTNNAMLKYLEFLSSYPFLIVESENTNEKFKQNMNTTIMQLCEGKGRGRSNSENKLQPIEKWHNLIFAACENRLVDNTAGGGTENRLLTLEVTDENPLFTTTSPENAMLEVDRFVNEAIYNSGHIVPALFTKIGDKLDKVIKELQTEYEWAVRGFNECYYDMYSPKTINMFALIPVGEALYWKLDGAEQTVIDLQYCIEKFGKTKKEVDKSERAWEYFKEYIFDHVEHLNKIRETQTKNGKTKKETVIYYNRDPFIGYLSPKSLEPKNDSYLEIGKIYITPLNLRKILADGGFNLDSVEKSWILKERLTEKKNIKIENSPQRLYTIKSNYFFNLTITAQTQELYK